MHFRGWGWILALFVGLASSCHGAAPEPTAVKASEEAPAEPFDDWYPEDVSPPAGTAYHCKYPPLPRPLPGIPTGDRRFINHTFALIMKATHERLRTHALLGTQAPNGVEASYSEAVGGIADQIRQEAAPEGLRDFQNDVVHALALQQAFYAKALPMHRQGREWKEITQLPEGHEASKNLLAAWDLIKKRYPNLSPEMNEALYHHLCALDIY